jgi:hypothetical protein
MKYITMIVTYLKLHWVTVLALLTAAWAYAKPTVIAYVGAHPRASFWYGLVAVVIGFYLKSPTGGILTMFNKPKEQEVKPS